MASRKLRPSADVLGRRVGDEFVLVNLKSDEMFSLNSTGARAWELLAEGDDLDQIEQTVASEFHADRDEVHRELDSLVHKLEGAGLVVADA